MSIPHRESTFLYKCIIFKSIAKYYKRKQSNIDCTSKLLILSFPPHFVFFLFCFERRKLQGLFLFSIKGEHSRLPHSFPARVIKERLPAKLMIQIHYYVLFVCYLTFNILLFNVLTIYLVIGGSVVLNIILSLFCLNLLILHLRFSILRISSRFGIIGQRPWRKPIEHTHFLYTALLSYYCNPLYNLYSTIIFLTGCHILQQFSNCPIITDSYRPYLY